MPPLSRSDTSLVRIEHLRQSRAKVPSDLEPQLARFACVLLSGYLENRFEEILDTYVTAKTGHENINRIVSRFIRLQNPNAEKIRERLSWFSQQWAEEFDAIPESWRSAITSIVDNRNLISHGGTAGISWAVLDDYQERAIYGMDEVEQIVWR